MKIEVDEKLYLEDIKKMDDAIIRYMQFREAVTQLVFPDRHPASVAEREVLSKIARLKEKIKKYEKLKRRTNE